MRRHRVIGVEVERGWLRLGRTRRSQPAGVAGEAAVQVPWLRLGAPGRPLLLVPPAVDTHHEDAHRRLVVDTRVLAAETGIEPALLQAGRRFAVGEPHRGGRGPPLPGAPPPTWGSAAPRPP